MSAEEKAVEGVGAPRLVRCSSFGYVGIALLAISFNYAVGENVKFGQLDPHLLGGEGCVEQDVRSANPVHNADVQGGCVGSTTSSFGYPLGNLLLGTPNRDAKLSPMPKVVSLTGRSAYKEGNPSANKSTEKPFQVLQEIKEDGEITLRHIGLWFLSFSLQVVVGVLLAKLIVQGGMRRYYKWRDDRSWVRNYGVLNSPTNVRCAPTGAVEGMLK